MEFTRHKTTRIPTLLGLSLLITSLVLGIGIYLYQQKTLAAQKNINTPKDIQVINLSDSQATVIWWTTSPTTGQIKYGNGDSPDQIQKDNRDLTEIANHQIHFVTLRNLIPETKYTYQIASSGFYYPDKPLTFTTAKALDESSPNRPLRGSVLNVNLNPIDEALVFLQINGASEMATFTSTAGNFIIPLKELRTTDLSSPFTIAPNTPATLTIKKGEKQSQVDLILPLSDKQLLPPLTLGQNINLRDLLTQTVPVKNISSTTETSLEYDLNKDSKINSLDLAIISQNKNKKIDQKSSEELKKADLNKDGIIDQADADLLVSKL